jgi:pantoate--beta-alanine ligase
VSAGLEVVATRTELADALTARRRAGERVGLVPTMGALHEGHSSLMRRAAAEVDGGPVVVSVFVNPLQFGPGEDLDRYPRTLDADLAVCESHGVDLVFAPAVEEVYPTWPPQVTVDPGPLGEVLDGASRPGHFAGVLTVVAKLFGLVRPDVAVFGQKDYQQLVLVRRMVADLCLGVDVVGAETVREPDGLALSSRKTATSTRRVDAPPSRSAAPCRPRPRRPSTASTPRSPRRAPSCATRTRSTSTTSRSPRPTSHRCPTTSRPAPRRGP